MRLGELLIQDGVITAQQLEQALSAQRRAGGLLGEHLLRQRAVSEDLLRFYLHQQRSQARDEENRATRLALIKDLLARFYATSRLQINLCLIFLLLSVCLTLSFPYYIKLVFDVLIHAGDFSAIVAVSLLMLATQLFARWTQYVALQLFNTTNMAFSGRLRRTIYANIALMRYSTYARYGAGTLLNRVTTDVDNVLTRWEHLFINFFKNLFSITISCSILLLVDPVLTIIVLLLSITIILLPGRISNGANPFLSRRPGYQSQVIGLLKDQLYGFKLLKAFNLQRSAAYQFGQIFDEYYVNDHRMVKHWNLAFNLRQTLGLLLSGVVLFVGGYNVMHDRYTIGDLALFILTVNMLAPYIDEFMQLMISVNDVKRYWQRCLEIVELNVDPARFERTVEQPAFAGTIALEHVGFAYGTTPVFRDLTLTIERNKSYGMIGKSGSGKSTLLKLLLKDLIPQQGRIRYDNTDLAEISEYMLAKNVSYIAQTPLIFPATVYENLQLGGVALSDSLRDEDLYTAARKSGIHDTILRLPDGYQTVIGEGGARLSGGEQQRISIARALVKSPPIFLLDEPTSALDPDNERLVLRSIQELMGRHTLLISTHNLALLDDVDYVIVVNGDATQVFRRDEISAAALLKAMEHGAEQPEISTTALV
jgi:ABC-type bacteriocin/lantibiotic exporter with double-glycine peptidase domain